ncbi:MAG: hypothetical protein WBP12_00685 [Candidatus Saccharimonas sp.]
MSETTSELSRMRQDVFADARVLSDAGLIDEGAEYCDGRLSVTPEQLATIQAEYEAVRVVRNRHMATRALAMRELVRGGALHSGGVLLLTDEQIATLHMSDGTFEATDVMAPEPYRDLQTYNSTLPVHELLSATENEQRLNASIAEIIHPYDEMIVARAPQQRKGLFGPKDFQFSREVRHHLPDTPPLFTTYQFQYKWNGETFARTKAIASRGLDGDDSNRRFALTAAYDDETMSSVLVELPYDTSVIYQALMTSNGLFRELPGAMRRLERVYLQLGEKKKLSVVVSIDAHPFDIRLNYQYSSSTDRFEKLDTITPGFPTSISTAVVEAVLRDSLSLIPTEEY